MESILILIQGTLEELHMATVLISSSHNFKTLILLLSYKTTNEAKELVYNLLKITVVIKQ